MRKKATPPTEREIDDIVVAQADDDAAWGKSVHAKKSEPTNVPLPAWDNKANPRKPLGQWLIENMPRGVGLEIPDRGSAREVPFSDEDDE